MSALYNLVAYQQWQAAITHIKSLADGDAANQVFYQSQYGDTAVMCTPVILGATGTRSADDHEGQARLEEEVPAGHHHQRWMDAPS